MTVNLTVERECADHIIASLRVAVEKLTHQLHNHSTHLRLQSASSDRARFDMLATIAGQIAHIHDVIDQLGDEFAADEPLAEDDIPFRR